MENQKEQPKVINKSGTLKMEDSVAATRTQKDIGGRRMDRRNNRRHGHGRDSEGPKEFDSVTIAIDRVSRTVKGGRRMRFKALVALGDHKNRIGIGVAKGSDVTTAVSKATSKAKKSMITFALDKETLWHEVETKVTGATVLMKPAAPGTGIIAGNVIRSIVGLTGIKNLVSKSLGSTNKVNIAYAVVEGLRQQTPRSEWNTTKMLGKSAKPAEKAKEATKKEVKAAKPAAKTTKKAASKETK